MIISYTEILQALVLLYESSTYMNAYPLIVAIIEAYKKLATYQKLPQLTYLLILF